MASLSALVALRTGAWRIAPAALATLAAWPLPRPLRVFTKLVGVPRDLREARGPVILVKRTDVNLPPSPSGSALRTTNELLSGYHPWIGNPAAGS